MPPADRFGLDGLARWDRGFETWVTFDPFPMHPTKQSNRWPLSW